MAVQGLGMDMIGQINPPSSKGHQWVFAVMDYFTKWVEASTHEVGGIERCDQFR